jgi:hypothetical protein
MTIGELRVLIGNQIGLPSSFDGSMTDYGNLSREQQIELTQAMFAYIKAHPANFTGAQVEVVNAEDSRDLTLLPEDYDFVLLINELESNAYEIVGKPLVSIGKGISSSVNLVGTLLPVTIVCIILLFAWPYIIRAKNSN